MSVTVGLRSLVVFVVGLSVVVVVVFHAVTADAVGDGESTFVPIEPCRLFDTRPGATNVGPKASPLGPDEAHAFQVTGSNGDCTIPTAATAVSINVTGVAPTAATNLRMFPAGEPVPTAAVLNMTAGQAPLPNKLDVKLSADGRVAVYNRFGQIHVVGDVMGYYRSDGLADLEARLTTLEATTAQLEAEQPMVWTSRDEFETVTFTQEVVVSVEVTAPAAGNITVVSTTAVSDSDLGEEIYCSITSGTDLDFDHLQWFESGGFNSGYKGQLSGVRTWSIRAAETTTYSLVCRNNSGTSSDLDDSTLAAIFTPAP